MHSVCCRRKIDRTLWCGIPMATYSSKNWFEYAKSCFWSGNEWRRIKSSGQMLGLLVIPIFHEHFMLRQQRFHPAISVYSSQTCFLVNRYSNRDVILLCDWLRECKCLRTSQHCGSRENVACTFFLHVNQISKLNTNPTVNVTLQAWTYCLYV